MPMPKCLRTCVVQFPVSLDPAANAHVILKHLDRADRGTLLVFPEGAVSGYSDNLEFLNAINRARLEEALAALKEAARTRGVHLALGSCLPFGQQWFNSGIYFGPDGESHLYHKVNLAIGERSRFTPGSRLSFFRIRTGDAAATAAFQLCREVRFPNQWSSLARQGVDLFIFPTHALGDGSQAEVWRSHLISRAAENQRFVLSANSAGNQQKCPSMIISPQGRVLWQAPSEAEAAGTAELDLSLVSDWYLSQARPELVLSADSARGMEAALGGPRR